MPKYIDAERLKDEYYELFIHGTIAVKSVLDVFVTLLDKQPTADVEEVVRCCDCTYAHFNPDANAFKCQRRGYYSEEVKPDDFCNHGVRMVTNNGNK